MDYRSTMLAVAICPIVICVTLTAAQESDGPQATPQRVVKAQSTPSASENPFLPPGVDDTGWPFVRGPTYDGHSPEVNLADSWPAGGPPVLWVRELGQGYSGFVSAGNRVYTQYQSIGGQYVICLDADNGTTIWEYWYDWPFEATGLYPGPRSTPTIVNDRLLFTAPSGLVGCLDRQGKLIWSVNVTEKFDGRGTEFGYSCSPTVVDDIVLLPVGGKGASMVALDVKDGSTRWQSGDDSASYTPAYPITVDGHRQIVGYLEHALAAFDLKTGKQLWRMPISQGYDEHAAWPIYSEPYLWISGPFRGGSQLVKLTGGPDASYERVRNSKLMSNDVASSVLVGRHIYGFDLRDVQAKAHRASRGAFRCIELVSGEQSWANGNPNSRRRSEHDADNSAEPTVGHASVIVADGKLILFNDTGELILAQADSERYQEVARISVLSGEICWTAPALHNGRLYLRNPKRAVCLDLGEPGFRQSASKTATLTVADIPQQTFWDVSQLLGVEPEYAFDVPTVRWLIIWYTASLFGILGVAGMLTGLTRVLLGDRISRQRGRRIFWTLAFLLGVVATTPLSLWCNEFVFTWPVALFVAFQAMVFQVGTTPATADDRWHPWRARGIALGFIAACLAYFLMCRRLSLVTEWVFLAGFFAALPFTLFDARLARRQTRHVGWNIILTTLAFTAYYWGSVAVLFVRYEVVTA